MAKSKTVALSPGRQEALRARAEKIAAMEATITKGIRFGGLPVTPMSQATNDSPRAASPVHARAYVLSKLRDRGVSSAVPLKPGVSLEEARAMVAESPPRTDCGAIVRRYPELLALVPEALRSYSLCEIAMVSSMGAASVFEHVPKACLDEPTCLRAIAGDPRSLRLIPIDRRTTRIEMKALSRDPALRLHATRPGVLDAVDRGWTSAGLLKVAEERRTFNACVNAMVVASDRSAQQRVLKSVAPSNVKQLFRSGRAVKHIHDEFFRSELFDLLIKASGGRAVLHFPQLTTEQLERAVQIAGRAITFLPTSYWSEKVCALAAGRSPGVWALIAEEMGVEFYQRVVALSAGMTTPSDPEDEAWSDDDIFAGLPWEPDEDDDEDASEAAEGETGVPSR
ncbi:hypothetical protein [Variovorax ginsengisoli]|uniref:Uncharacterized protein n=1 Tax=Variovorax ginsengisoli TaxID=363844 RepID=A0ABT8SBM2_9BURK|nr:hypothetical protein [Variovorax ginsengisoli]MDN8616514.1 hypothetical protein [Variovorax ginsengisoli]MDO1535684.1 hypothetical protein [Variovorax ginsengisoli]